MACFFLKCKGKQKKSNLRLVTDVTDDFGTLWPVGFGIERGGDVSIQDGGGGTGQFLDCIVGFALVDTEKLFEGSFFHAIHLGFPCDGGFGVDAVNQFLFADGGSDHGEGG